MTHAPDSTRLRRAPVVRIYDVRDTTVLVTPDQTAHELRGDSARLARALLAFTLAPRTRAEILEHVAELTGGPVEDPRVVDELIGLLRSTGALVEAALTERPRPTGGARPRLVLALSGAIAAALAPELIERLQRRGFQVRVIATEAALRFVQASVLEALVHHPVRADLWPGEGDPPVPHIALARWADAVLVCPASATTISRLATGDHSTLVSAVALATRAPVVVVPSMNVEMYAEPAVQRNVAQLIEDGFHLVQPGSGVELASAPGERESMLGPMPPSAAVVDTLAAVLRLDRARRGESRSSAPRDPDEWDAIFRTREATELDWHTDSLDEDLARVLEREAPAGARVLDVGTGLGVAARMAAGRGCQVVATDVSATALARAAERAAGAAIVWVRDDITDSRLHGEFDVILDRGCLHLLDPDRALAYASAMTRLLAPDGVLLLKTHAPSEGDARATTPYDRASIERLLGHAFVLEADDASTFPGPREAPAARLFVLRRHG